MQRLSVLPNTFAVYFLKELQAQADVEEGLETYFTSCRLSFSIPPASHIDFVSYRTRTHVFEVLFRSLPSAHLAGFEAIPPPQAHTVPPESDPDPAHWEGRFSLIDIRRSFYEA